MKHKSLKLSFSANRGEGLGSAMPCDPWDWAEAFTPLSFSTRYVSDAAWGLSGVPAINKK